MKFRPSKYQQIFSISWSSGFVYRLNFVMWRVRTVIQLLTVYLLWAAILQNNSNPAGYTAPELLTYIFLTSILRSVVFASRSMQVQSDIANGDLNNYLLKPLNIFSYWLSRDLADKHLNILFSLGEITLLYFLLKPPLVVPANSFYLITFILSVILGTFIYFYFSFIISTSVFWMPEGAGWPQRFLIFVLMEFLAGGIFPLDILIQCTTGTPQDARVSEAWVHENKAEYIDCAITGSPSSVGTPNAHILLAGQESVFRKIEPILRTLADNLDYKGEPIGLAST